MLANGLRLRHVPPCPRGSNVLFPDSQNLFTNPTDAVFYGLEMGYPEQSIDPDHLARIAAIERLAGKFDAFPRLGEQLVADLRRRSIIASMAALLRLEGKGIRTEDVEYAIDAMEENRLDFGRHSDEIMEFYRTWKSHQRVDDGNGKTDWRAINLASLAGIHTALLSGVSVHGHSAGRLRGDGLVVRAFDAEGAMLGDVFEAPSPVEISKSLNETFEGVRDELAAGKWHPLLLVSWLLARLLAIQPFQTASTRSAHLVCNMLLQDLGYGHIEFRSLEEFMAEDAGNYFVALRRYRRTMGQDESGLQEWHSFFLGCLARQASGLEEDLRRIRDEAEFAPLQQRLLELARSRDQLTVREAMEATDANRNTLKVHLNKLVQRGGLVRKGIGKGTWYELG